MRSAPLYIAVLLATTGAAQAEQITISNAPAELRYYQDVSLTPEAQADFDRLLNDGYFSAFAMAPDGTYGYSTGNNALGVAQRDALSYCASAVMDPTLVCSLVAESVPLGYRDGDKVSLGMTNGESYAAYQNLGGAKAFAASDGRTVGWAYEYDSVAAAESRAMQECEAVRIRNLDSVSSAGPCRILSSRP